MAEHAAREDAECVEQPEGDEYSAIEFAQFRLPATHRDEHGRDHDVQHADGDPDVAAVAWRDERHEIARQHQATCRNDGLAHDVVNARLADTLNDLLDIIQRLRGFLRVDLGHEPGRALATSSATPATALGSLTMPR